MYIKKLLLLCETVASSFYHILLYRYNEKNLK